MTDVYDPGALADTAAYQGSRMAADCRIPMMKTHSILPAASGLSYAESSARPPWRIPHVG